MVKNKHLLVIWPQFVNKEEQICDIIRKEGGFLIYINRFVITECVLVLIVEKLYEHSEYEKNRIKNKTQNLLKYIKNGLVVICFTFDDGEKTWSDERKKYIYKKVLSLKQRIRDSVDAFAQYETIHMTDDEEEFNHDISMISTVLEKENEYIDSSQIVNNDSVFRN